MVDFRRSAEGSRFNREWNKRMELVQRLRAEGSALSVEAANALIAGQAVETSGECPECAEMEQEAREANVRCDRTARAFSNTVSLLVAAKPYLISAASSQTSPAAVLLRQINDELDSHSRPAPETSAPSNPVDVALVAELKRLSKHYGGYVGDQLGNAALRIEGLTESRPETPAPTTPDLPREITDLFPPAFATVYVFGVKRKIDSEPWYVAFKDQHLADAYGNRCTGVTAVLLYERQTEDASQVKASRDETGSHT